MIGVSPAIKAYFEKESQRIEAETGEKPADRVYPEDDREAMSTVSHFWKRKTVDHGLIKG
jgi:hypothetical protein